MSSNDTENKNNEEKKEDELNNINSSNSVNNTSMESSNSDSSTNEIKDTNNEHPAYPQNEVDLSEIETGSKDQPDFEEMINFTHTYLNYRIAKTFPDRQTLDTSTFDLLTTNVFIFSGDIMDFQSMTSLANLYNSEAVKNIRQKINSYKDSDISNKITFIK